MSEKPGAVHRSLLSRHAVRLHHDIAGSRLRLWPETGHMLHHVHPKGVIQAIDEAWEMAKAPVAQAPHGDARLRSEAPVA